MKRGRILPPQKNKKGLTLIEAGIVLVVLGIIVAAIFMVAPKLMNSSRSDSAFQRIESVVRAAENVKSENSGAYRATAAATDVHTAASVLFNALGGAAASNDLAGWTYECPVGSASTITIVTTGFETPEVALATVDKINSRLRPWTAVLTAPQAITITQNNANCQ